MEFPMNVSATNPEAADELLIRCNEKLRAAVEELYAKAVEQYGPEIVPLLRPVVEMPWNQYDDPPKSVTVKLVPRFEEGEGF